MVSKCERKRKIINNRQPLLFSNLSRNLSQLSPLLNQLKQKDISNDKKIQLKQKINEIQQKMNQQYNIKGNFKLLLDDTECTFNPILSAMANEPQLERFLKNELQVSTFNDLRKKIRKLNNKQVIKLIRNHEKVNKPLSTSTTAPPPPPPPPGMAPLPPPPPPGLKKVEPEIKLPIFKEYKDLGNEKTTKNNVDSLLVNFEEMIEEMKKTLDKINSFDPEYFKKRLEQLLKLDLSDKQELYQKLDKIFFETIINKNIFGSVKSTKYKRKFGNNNSLLTKIQKEDNTEFLNMLKQYIERQEGYNLFSEYLKNLKLIKAKQAEKKIEREKQNFEKKQKENKEKQIKNRKLILSSIKTNKEFFNNPPRYNNKDVAQETMFGVISQKIDNLSKIKNKINNTKKKGLINKIIKLGNLENILSEIKLENNKNNENKIYKQFYKYIQTKKGLSYVARVLEEMSKNKNNKQNRQLPEYNINNNNKNETEVEKLLKEISNKKIQYNILETYYDVLKDIEGDDKFKTYLSKQKGFNSVRNFINSQKKR